MPQFMNITAHDGGEFTGYLAGSGKGKRPGILVIQEIFGVNKVMRSICDDLAEAGYLALCPDLFWRQEPGIDITDQSQEEWDKAFELFNGFDVGLGVEDLKSSLGALRGLDECSGLVGTVGYCLGGKMAYLMACRSDVDCAVSYYGVGLDELIVEASNIAHPTLLHMARLDQFVPPDAQAKIEAGIKDNDHVTLHAYENVDHAFARIGGEHFNKEAATLANRRTAEFFKEHLINQTATQATG